MIFVFFCSVFYPSKLFTQKYLTKKFSRSLVLKLYMFGFLQMEIYCFDFSNTCVQMYAASNSF